MDNLSEEFDYIFLNKGGLLKEHSSLINNGSNFLEAVLELGNRSINWLRNGNSKLPEPYINFINNSSLNAVVTKYNDKYFIGLNSGTVVLINQLFLRMLSNPNVLTQWGNPSLETVDTDKILNAQITNLDIYYLASADNQAKFPKDSTRSSLSSLMTMNALKFIMMHEYGHIVMGHLDFIRTINESSFYFEFEETSKLHSLISQTLEMDADCFGINIGIREIEMQIEKRTFIPNEFKQFYKDFESSLSLYIFSIYSFFRLFGMEKIDFATLESLSHPPSGFRQNIFLSLLATLYQSKGDEYAKGIGDMAVYVSFEVERAFDEISFQGLDASTFLSSFDSEAMAHITKIRKNWINVRSLLEPYAFSKLAAIQD